MFQTYTDVQLILGIGIWLGLTFVFVVLTYRNKEAFVGFLTMFSAIVVWAGIVPVWLCVISLMGVVFVIGLGLRERRGR